MNKVLYITPVFPQQRVMKTIETLINKSYAVTILTYQYDNKKDYIIDKNDRDKLKIINLNLKGKNKILPFKNILFRKKIHQLKQESFNLIIYRDIFSYDLASYLSKKMNCKMVIDIADNYPEVFRTKFSNKILNKILYNFTNIIEKKAIKKSHKVLIVTELSKELLKKKHKIINDHKFLILKNYPSETKKKKFSDIKVKEKTIVYIGTVDENVRDLGRVFDFIKNSEYMLDIYSSNKKLVEKLIEQHEAKKNVNYFEPVNRKLLSRELAQYKIGIIPHKLIEGTKYTIPNKLYDYINSNLIVLSTNNDALTYEIDRLGVGEVYRNSENFIETLEHLDYNSHIYNQKINEAKKICKWELQENIIMEMFNK